MSRCLVVMFVGATIAAAASTSGSAYHCLASAVNFNAPVHAPRRWGWLPNRMVPAVLGFSLFADLTAS